ncbi:MAG: MFS transporter, partial [Azospirillum brasilense]
PWIFGGIFISGVARAFIMPASFSLLPQIVTRADIPAASAWLSSGFQFAAIVGPALAGIIYGSYGNTIGWAMPTLLMSIALAMVASMSAPTRAFRSHATHEPAMQSITAGWRFIWQNQVLLSVMALDMFAVLFGGVVAILPAYVDQVLQTGSEGLGALRAAPAIGAIAMALYLALKPMQKIRAVHLLWVITGFGLCMLGFGLTTHFWVAMAMLAASGAFDSVSMVIRSTLMQLLIPEDMRGRVSSVNSMFIISSNEIGAFRAGTGAAWLGLVPSILMGGVGTLLVVGITAWRAPRLRKLVVDVAK